MTTPDQSHNAPQGSSGENDSFKRLYKMSTTAGVGAVDYVAINVPSVVAILAGIASVTVLMSNSLLFVPAFAVLAGVIALIQITKAGGTQGGKSLAIGGIALAVIFSGIVMTRDFAESQRIGKSRAQIQALLDTFAADCAAEKYADAYKLFSEDFKKTVSAERFEGELKSIAAAPNVGKIQRINWNGLLESIPTPGSARDVTRASVKMVMEKIPDGVELTPILSRPSGQTEWQFESINPLFQPPPAAKGGAGGAGGGAGGMPPG